MSRVERAKRLMMGPDAAPSRLGHWVTVRSELAALATFDRVRVRRDPERDDWLADRLTVTAKTFCGPTPRGGS